jgi:hypothetical protein
MQLNPKIKTELVKNSKEPIKLYLFFYITCASKIESVEDLNHKKLSTLCALDYAEPASNSSISAKLNRYSE